MQSPLKGLLVVTCKYGVVGSQWKFGKHFGTDLRAAVGTPLYAPEDGVINERYVGSKGILVLGLAGTKWHRFLHLDSFAVPLNAQVKAGQLIGYTGNTGQVAAHLHWDVRKPNTLWSSSFSNYFDPMVLLKEEKTMAAQDTIVDRNMAQKMAVLGHFALPNETREPAFYKSFEGKPFWQAVDILVGGQEWREDETKIKAPESEAQKKLASAKTKAQDIIDL